MALSTLPPWELRNISRHFHHNPVEGQAREWSHLSQRVARACRHYKGDQSAGEHIHLQKLGSAAKSEDAKVQCDSKGTEHLQRLEEQRFRSKAFACNQGRQRVCDSKGAEHLLSAEAPKSSVQVRWHGSGLWSSQPGYLCLPFQHCFRTRQRSLGIWCTFWDNGFWLS
jgi:hypothetical protein